MKFQKFVKSIGSDGVIHVRKNGERWLASASVFMKIPNDIRSITASDIITMPEAVEKILNYESLADPCELHKAVMPEADGTIKDCVEMYVEVDSKDMTPDGKALYVKGTEHLQVDPVTIGIIFPTTYEV